MGERMGWWAVFAAVAAWTTLWSLSTAPIGAPDEAAHVVKAVAVARGELQTSFERFEGKGGFRASIPLTHVEVPDAYPRLSSQTDCWQTHLDRPSACAPDLPAEAGPVRDATTYVGTYPPVYYGLTGWPSLFLPPNVAFYAMRIVGGLICAALAASAVASARRLARGRLAVLGVALAVTPMTMFLAGAVNPNAVQVTAAVALWASLAALLASTGRPPTRLVVRTVVAAMLLATVRPLGPAVLAGTVVVTLLATWDRAAVARLWADRRIRIGSAVTALVAVVTAVFVAAVHSLDALIEFHGLRTGTATERARMAIENMGRPLEQAIGMLSWPGPGEVHLPVWIIDGWIVLTALVVAGALVVGRARQRLAMATLLVASLGVPVLAEVASPYTNWQGRYGLPLLVGLPVLGTWVLEDRLWWRPRLAQRWEAGTSGAGAAVVVAIAAAQLTAQQVLMTRNVVGLPNGVFASVGASNWDGPLTPATLFGWALVAAVGYAAVLVTLVTRRATMVHDRLHHGADEGRRGSDLGVGVPRDRPATV